MSRIYSSLLPIAIGFSVSFCGAQTEQRDAVKKVVKETETVSSTSPTSLAISDGSLQGSEVTIPVGALPENSNVAVDLTDTPADFVKTTADGSAIASASSSMSIEATDEGGSAISTLSSPMTVAIAYASPTALSLVEQSDDNLCAFLKSDAGLFVWRKSHIDIVDGKASFSTRHLGVFQLTFCGQEALEGFEDIANNPAIAGSVFKLTIDSSVLGYNAQQYCIALLGGEDENGDHSIHGGATAAIDGKKHTLEISYLPSDFSADKTPYVVVFFQDTGAKCLTAGTTTKDLQMEYSRIIGFPTTAAKLTAGIDATLGSDDFALTTFKIGTGTPEGTTQQYSNVPQEKMCAGFDTQTGGFAELNMLSSADGLLNGTNEVDMVIPTSIKDSYQAYVDIGTYCDSDTKDAFAYEIALKKPKSDKFSLVAVNFTAGATACVQVYQGGTLNSNGAPIATINVPDSGSRVAFVPWDNTSRNTTTLNPKYDLLGHPNVNCSQTTTSSGLAKELEVEMTTEINVQAPATPTIPAGTTLPSL